MQKERLVAFTDGVFAILITITVLEVKPPHEISWQALLPVIPHLLSYVMSFIYLGIYWSNHHHMYHLVPYIRGSILWANLHLLFWLSLFPFATAWMGENDFAPVPTMFYGGVLFMAALAYHLMQQVIIRAQGKDSALGKAVGLDWKGVASPIIYFVAMLLAWVSPGVACVLYAVVAALWIVPDTRVERVLKV